MERRRCCVTDYERALRELFPTIFFEALRISEDEAEAAWIAQMAFLHAYADLDRPSDGSPVR